MPTDPPPVEPRLLFVDDDPAVVAGLRRMLRARRVEADLTFATGPDEALAHLSAGAFDGVVSDMRMPDMDGASLLAVVRERSPATVRVILSGQTERSAAVRAAGVAHRFLDKPTHPDELVATVAAIGKLARQPLPAGVRAVLGRLACLPARPDTLACLARALAGPETASGTSAVVAAVAEPAVAAKLAQLASSAFLGPPALAGTDAELAGHVRPGDLAAIQAAGSLASDPATPAVAALVELLPARAGRLLALAEALHGRPLPPPVRLGARLRDVGRLVAAVLAGDLATADPGTLPPPPLLGGHLLAIWGLPDEVVAVVAAPAPDDPGAATGPLDACLAVALADARDAAEHGLPPVTASRRAGAVGPP